MSILVVGVDAELAEVLIPRLVDQGDEVRLLENDEAEASRFRELGAYIAHGDPADPDLVMRAATGCRSVVAAGAAADGEALAGIVEGAGLAGVERVILCTDRTTGAAVEMLRRAGTQYVVLVVGRRRLWNRRAAAPENVAAAVDAADDLGGDVRLELDLRDDGAWRALRLPVPPKP